MFHYEIDANSLTDRHQYLFNQIFQLSAYIFELRNYVRYLLLLIAYLKFIIF